MTNKIVINFLNQVRKILLGDKSWLESTIQPINEAFDIAISALQAQDLQPTCNNLATDAISRQTAQERQRVAQKRKYTFGNGEFSLEDAYHDCKLVFDGITDDNSFQEADTGLVLYYANEIIYALHEALEGKDTNILSNDCISRQTVVDMLSLGKEILSRVLDDTDVVGTDREKYSWGLGLIEVNIKDIEELPPAQPEYEPVKAEDFAKTMSENTLFGFMAWHSEALELMKRHGFVICKKTL